MKLKYLIGRSIATARDRLLSIQSLPLLTGVPYDLCWPYDIARYAGTRQLKVIVDAGANIGQTALYLRRFFPDSTVHCFEPVPATFSRLTKAVRAYPNIHAHSIALSSHSGSVYMREEDEYPEASAVTTERTGAVCQVPSQTLDEFAAKAGIERINILKVDVEGHEIPLLDGAAGLLAERRIQAVYIEIGVDTRDLGHTHFSRVHAALEPSGFVFSGLYGIWRYRERYRVWGANALYWNPEFRH